MTQAKFFEEKEDFEEEEIPRPRKPGEAPDGGWGWVVVIGSFLCNLFIEGLIFSFPYLKDELGEYYEVSTSAAGMVGILLMAFCHLTGKTKVQGPVVQSIISLTSSLRGQLIKCFTTL